jgi:hypothetical protein
MAVPWLRRLDAGLSTRRPGLASGLVRVGFMIKKMALGHFVQDFQFSPVSVIPPRLSILMYHLEDEQ